MRVIGEALRAALVVGGLLALADLWQVAAREPASLGAGGVAWLVALHLGATLLVALGAFALAAAAGREAAGIRPWVRAALVCTGGALLACEAALRALPPLSPWRPAAVVAAVATAAALVAPAARRVRRVPVAVAAAGLVLLGAGAVGAGRGFTRPEGAGMRAPGREAPGTVGRSDRGPQGRDASEPNVVLVLIDTLRADHLGCYGYARPTSPRLDAFAREGVLFERAFSQSSWTKPAVASLFTSHYPSTHRTNLESSKLPAAETTLAELLGASGWTTAAFSGNPWITPEYGFDRGFAAFHAVHDERFARVTLFMTALKRVSQLATGQSAWPYNPVKRLVVGEPSTTARDELVNRAASAWLAANAGRRFFLYVHYMSPHHPYDPPPPYDRFVPDRAVRPRTGYPQKSYFFFEQGEPLAEPERQDMIARYDGDILFADAAFGALLDELARTGVLDRTLVVVVGDHGEEFYDHRNWGHGQSVYNELLHVPLLLRLPGVLPAGARVAEPAMLVDVLPTVLDLVAVPPYAGATGRSLAAVAAGAPAARVPQAYAELLYRWGAARAVVQDGDKLIETARGEERRRELYRLDDDFAERHDLVGVEPGRAGALAGTLAEVRRGAEEHRAASAAAPIGDEQAEGLRALGYLQE